MKQLIYIAEDEKNIRETLRSFLENDGYEVCAFEKMCIRDSLKPSEGTQKTADEAAEQHTEQNEKSCDVV